MHHQLYPYHILGKWIIRSKNSFSKFKEVDEGNEKRELHEIFEDDARVNKKKVTFTIILRVMTFIRIFEGLPNQDLLIDRLVVALMHKKPVVGESNFIGRSLISAASNDDDDVNLLSNVLLMKTEPRKIKLLTTHSVIDRDINFHNMTPQEKLARNFLDRIADLESQEDKEFFMEKLDKINKEANAHFQSLSNSPIRHDIRGREMEEQESGNVSENLILKLNEVKAQQEIEDTPFKQLSEKPIDNTQFIKEELEEDEDLRVGQDMDEEEAHPELEDNEAIVERRPLKA